MVLRNGLASRHPRLDLLKVIFFSDEQWAWGEGQAHEIAASMNQVPCNINCLLFIVLFAKNYTNQITSNYLNSHGEETQEKPPGL